MTDEETLADLNAKLKARTGRFGYEENIRELEAEIAALEAKTRGQRDE